MTEQGASVSHEDEDPKDGDFAIVEDVEQPGSKSPYRAINIPQHREQTRRYLALVLTLLLSLVVLGAGGLVAANYPGEEIRSFLEVVFTPLVTLTASVLGFYFGSTDDRR